MFRVRSAYRPPDRTRQRGGTCSGSGPPTGPHTPRATRAGRVPDQVRPPALTPKHAGRPPRVPGQVRPPAPRPNAPAGRHVFRIRSAHRPSHPTRHPGGTRSGSGPPTGPQTPRAGRAGGVPAQVRPPALGPNAPAGREVFRIRSAHRPSDRTRRPGGTCSGSGPPTGPQTERAGRPPRVPAQVRPPALRPHAPAGRHAFRLRSVYRPSHRTRRPGTRLSSRPPHPPPARHARA